MVVVVGLSWAILEFGSLGHAWRYAGGVRLLVDQSTIVVPAGRVGDDRGATLLVHNLSAEPVRILGVNASCSCVSTDGLPVAIPPRGSRELGLRLHLEKSASGTIEQVVTYHTDEPTLPSFSVRVVGRLIED